MRASHLVLLTLSFVLAPNWGPRAAKADLVLLGFGEVTWDITGLPSLSPLLSLRLDTDGMGTHNSLNGMNLGIIITPRVGATGAISFFNAFPPSSGAVFGGYSISSSSPVAGLTVIDINDALNPGSNTPVAVETALADLQFETTGAAGLFDIYAIPEFTNYFYIPQGLDPGEASFANVSSTENFLLGTLNIPFDTSEVPEPGTVALIVLVGIFGGLFWRRRDRSPRRIARCGE